MGGQLATVRLRLFDGWKSVRAAPFSPLGHSPYVHHQLALVAWNAAAGVLA